MNKELFQGEKKNLSEQLQEIFLQNIRSGLWQPNKRIPAELHLAKTHRVCRSTVRRAIKELERLDLLSAAQGSGRVVKTAGNPAERMIGLVSKGDDLGLGNAGRVARVFSGGIAERGDHFVAFAFNGSGSADIGAEQLQRYAAFAGVALLGPAFPSRAVADLARRLPVVAIARDERLHGVPSFFIDYGAHAAMAAAKLLKDGHRQILVSHGGKPSFAPIWASIDRGVEMACLLAGEERIQHRLFCSTLSKEGGAELFQEVTYSGFRPTALICYSELVLLGFFEEAARCKVHDYDDLEVIVLNDTEALDIPARRVHCFKCPVEEMASSALDWLYCLIEKRAEGVPCSALRGELVTV